MPQGCVTPVLATKTQGSLGRGTGGYRYRSSQAYRDLLRHCLAPQVPVTTCPSAAPQRNVPAPATGAPNEGSSSANTPSPMRAPPTVGTAAASFLIRGCRGSLAASLIPYRSGVATSPRTRKPLIFDREALRASAQCLCSLSNFICFIASY